MKFCGDDLLIIKINSIKFIEKYHPFNSQTRYSLDKIGPKSNVDQAKSFLTGED